MIDRYTTPQMKNIFSRSHTFKKYLEVELALIQYLNLKGIVTNEEKEKIFKNAKFDLKGIDKLEKETKHDVIAFTRNVSSYLGDEKKRIHYGLTSSDVIDTAHSLLYKEANKIILNDLKELKTTLKEKAYKYKNTPCIGRTHGIHADITSFGLKWALYYDELERDIERFEHSSKNMEICKISGAVGTHVYLDIEAQDIIANILKLEPANISTQILQRDRHAEYISSITLIASLLEKIGVEIRNLARTEIHEVEEYFSKNQKGSSAMPHKHNPIGSENICGCARIIRGYQTSIYEDIALYHERDISHSSVERVSLIDAIILIDYMLKRMTNIIKNLVVYENNMLKNISLTNNIIYSQKVMTLLIERGLSREESYDLIQPLANKAYKENIDFFELLKENNEVLKRLSKKEIDNLNDSTFNSIPLDDIYNRVFK